MINLLFVLPQLGIGGSEHVVLELARGLDKTRFRSLVFAIKSGPMDCKFRQENVETIISKKERGKGHIQLMVQIYNTIKKYHIDIVLPHHMTSLFYSAFPARIFNRSKLYFTEHSVSGIISLSPSLRLLSIILLFLSSGCIAISREISVAYTNSLMVQPSKIVHIPNGIDIRRFEGPVDQSSKKMSLGIQPDDVIIGTVANMREVKNHRNLISAFKNVHSQISNVTLVLVGSGPLEKGLKTLTTDLRIADKVKFLGHRDDTSELYQIFDIFCLSSFAEGFPLVILEAMACKLPIVATDVSGINEIIQPGKNGYLVSSNNSAELADALTLLIQNRGLRNHLGTNGYQTASNQYSFNKWICKYDALFSATNNQRR